MPMFSLPTMELKIVTAADFVFLIVLFSWLLFVGGFAFGADNVGNEKVVGGQSAGCDIAKATIAQGCCRCDTGSICLTETNTFRKCVDSCYHELSCDGNENICKQLDQKCPKQSPAVKCAMPGYIAPDTKKSGGASYLQICGADYVIHEIQCSLTLKQKEAAACYEAQTNGLSAALAKIESSDGFKIGLVKDSVADFYINDQGGTVNCANIPGPKLSRQDFEKKVRMEQLLCQGDSQSDAISNGPLCQAVELACCLKSNSDHCQAYGCDKGIVYNSYYGCTKVNFGKQLVVKKSDGSDCAVCSPGTFGCGGDLTERDSNGIYAYKKCEDNDGASQGAPIGCWGESLPCVKGNADGCEQFCSSNAIGIRTWDKNALSAKLGCAKTLCFASGEIEILDTNATAQSCTYKKSTDASQSGCLKCHNDSAANEAVCDKYGGPIIGPPMIVGNEYSWQYDNLVIGITATASSQCRVGTAGGFDSLEWPTIGVSGQGNGFGGWRYSATITCDQIKSRLGSCERDFELLAICKNQAGESYPEHISVKSKSFASASPASLCAAGYSACGQYCYQPGNNLTCYGGGDFACDSGIPSGQTFNAGKNYYPNYICNDLGNVIFKLIPALKVPGGKEVFCDYSPTKICGVNQTCQNGQCIDDKNKKSGESLGIPGIYRYDEQKKFGVIDNVGENWRDGRLVDRKTGREIEPTTVKYGSKDEEVLIECDILGKNELNAALALMGASNIKSKEWLLLKDDQGNDLVGPDSGSYVCMNYSNDTQNMLEENGLKNVYTIWLTMTDASGQIGSVGHVVNGIKVGEKSYAQNGIVYRVPLIAIVEPQSGKVMGELGAGTPIVDVFNNEDGESPKRIDDAVAFKNYELSQKEYNNTPLIYDDSEVVTYALSAPYVALEGDEVEKKIISAEGNLGIRFKNKESNQ